MENEIFDIAIIGGGIVGAATFYRLQKHHPDLKIILIEKESRLAFHQTGNNSGVIHSGLYYKPGSLKARNCVEGRKALVQFAKEYNIPHDVCGKVVVATEESELPYLDKIFETGLKNHIEGIKKINAEEIKEHEPYCVGIAGIWVPCTGIIDYVRVTDKMAEIALQTNPRSELVLNTEAISFEKENGINIINTNKKSYSSRYLGMRFSITALFTFLAAGKRIFSSILICRNKPLLKRS